MRKKQITKIVLSSVITVLFSILLIQGIIQFDALQIVISFSCIGLMVILDFIILKVENTDLEKSETEYTYIEKVEDATNSIREKTEMMYDLVTRFDQVENELSDLVVKLNILTGYIDRFTEYISVNNTKLIEKNEKILLERQKIVFEYNQEYTRMGNIMKLINLLYEKSAHVLDTAQESSNQSREANILAVKAEIEAVKLKVEDSGFYVMAENISKVTNNSLTVSSDLLAEISSANEIISEIEQLISISNNFYKTALTSFKSFDMGEEVLVKDNEETSGKSLSIHNNIKTINNNISKINSLYHQLKELAKEYLKINNEESK
ncbi:MAG: hypothetical protein LBM99_03980 [Bacillales bacterium]|jgi:hypothetical protein|nr:hypothetical protein [Bacillales bacterium]